jgi:hypothetical protein
MTDEVCGLDGQSGLSKIGFFDDHVIEILLKVARYVCVYIYLTRVNGPIMKKNIYLVGVPT